MPAELIAAQLQDQVAGEVAYDADLAPFTTFRLGGPAQLMVVAETEDDLEAIGSVVNEHGLEFFVLGRGSNVLISDAGLQGLVVRLGKGFDWLRGAENGIEAGGGTPFPQLANWAARRSMSGLEFAIAIPAAVGGAVRMNAGAHGRSVSDALESVRLFRIETAAFEERRTENLDMTYRSTNLAPREVVCSAHFRLAQAEPAGVSSRMRKYRDHRHATQPLDAPNAGSMFRNPPGDWAGRLIEAAGLKGRRVGGARVSEKHANFFLASPGARSQHVFDLLALVQSEVERQSGILLVPEVRPVGKFDTSSGLRWSE